ncbi:MAG: phosphatidate cytidylyltransferase [Candidatus Babeliaceae bacterium]|nr:phosphatidate cytidylyltransferase [Candidatus Babeliaceae bacterium]
MNDFFMRTVTAIVLVSVGCLTFCFLEPLYFVVMLALVLGYVVAFEWPQFNIWWLTPLYPVVPFLALIHLYLQNPILWAWLVVVVASYDTGGYIIGSIWGKDKILPAVSPGKTWQGLIGGVVCAGFVGLFLKNFLNFFSFSSGVALIAGLAIGALAFWGDLFESYLKRQAELKDSGGILPGHGGVLDRIDGLLFAAFFIDFLIICIR